MLGKMRNFLKWYEKVLGIYQCVLITQLVIQAFWIIRFQHIGKVWLNIIWSWFLRINMNYYKKNDYIWNLVNYKQAIVSHSLSSLYFLEHCGITQQMHNNTFLNRCRSTTVGSTSLPELVPLLKSNIIPFDGMPKDAACGSIALKWTIHFGQLCTAQCSSVHNSVFAA